jgi:hypothetical protein
MFNLFIVPVIVALIVYALTGGWGWAVGAGGFVFVFVFFARRWGPEVPRHARDGPRL